MRDEMKKKKESKEKKENKRKPKNNKLCEEIREKFLDYGLKANVPPCLFKDKFYF